MGKQKKRKMPSLDLHGRRVSEVFDLVDAFVAKNQNQDRIEIISGKGTGQVKAEVVRYLKLGGYPWEHGVLDSGKKNGGSIIVIMS